MSILSIRPRPQTRTNWRPWPLRLTFILPFTILCLFIIVALELVLQACTPHGCPIFGEAFYYDTKAPAAKSYSVATSFVYNYLPTIFTVSFGLLCAVIHHDCMRMEPWFQLSREEGATAEDSLLIEYSYMFPPYVPWAAVKRRHYSVFVGSLIVILSTLVITPTTAGLFDDTTIIRFMEQNTTFPILRWAYNTEELRGFEENGEESHGAYSPRFSYLSYAHAWLNSSLPPFTTAEYALSPWAVASAEITTNAAFNTTATNTNDTSASVDSVPEKSWTAPTMLYEADLDCEEAIRTPLIYGPIGLLGYNLTYPSYPFLYWTLWDIGMVNNTDYDLMQTINNSSSLPPLSAWPYRNDRTRFETGADYYVIGDHPDHLSKTFPNVTEERIELAEHTALFIFASAPPEPLSPEGEVSTLGQSLLPKKWSAVFCQPRYYAHPVNATVLMPSGTVDNITRTGDRVLIPSSNETSIIGDLFPNLLNNLIRSVQTDPKYYDDDGNLVGLGKIPQKLTDSRSQLAKRFGGTEAALRVQPKQTHKNIAEMGYLAYALNTQTNSTLEDLFESENLAEMYRKALKLMFAMLCTDEWLISQSEQNQTATITQTEKVRGFRVNVGWCRASQAGFALIAVLAGSLGLLLVGRSCSLDGEPNSLTSTLALLYRSPEVVDQIESAEYHDMETVRRMLKASGKRFRLILEPGVGPRVETTKAEEATGLVPVKLEGPFSETEEEHKEKEEWPMSMGSAVFFMCFFVMMLALAVTLSIFVGLKDGIPSPAPQNSFGYKILFSYLPTLLSLVIEPLLVSLASHYYMLGPYKSLRQGFATSKKSLSIDFDKSPPHFQFLRSIRAGDMILGGLALSILLSNVLAVALGGMFSPNQRAFPLTLSVQSPEDPRFVGNFFNMSLQEPQYVLYSSLTGEIAKPNWTTTDHYILPFTLPAMEKLDTITAATIGFGASVSCALVPTSQITTSCLLKGSPRNHTSDECPTTNPSLFYGRLKVDDPCWPSGRLISSSNMDGVFEWVLPAGDYFAYNSQCPQTFFAVWAELPADPHSAGNISSAYIPAIDSLVLKCTSTEVGVHLTATVDAGGNVLAVKDVTPVATDELETIYGKDLGELSSTFLNATRTYYSGGYTTFLQLQWLDTSLVQLYPNIARQSRNLTHIPDQSLITDAFEDVYRRLFSMSLRLSSDRLLNTDGSERTKEIDATVTSLRDMVEVSMEMLAIGIGILLYTALVVMILYWRVRKGDREVAHAPKSLAAMWALLYGSDAKEVCGEVKGPNPSARAKEVDKLGKKYGYGRFMGKDGRSHVGVFMQAPGESEPVTRIPAFRFNFMKK